jgi:putative PIN family toxin of toxin-antitoxin system
MKIVVDTNVLLSAAWRDRLPERVVLHVATSSNCEWIVTDPILAEYVAVLKRRKFNLPNELIERWTDLVEMRTTVISIPQIATPPLRDPGDAIFLAAAIAGEANYFITGDNDLLNAKLSISTQIVSAADFEVLLQIPI